MGTFVPSQVLGFSFPLELVVALRQMSTLKVTQKGHFSSHLLKDPQENLLISKKCVGSFSELQPVGFLEATTWQGSLMKCSPDAHAQRPAPGCPPLPFSGRSCRTKHLHSHHQVLTPFHVHRPPGESSRPWGRHNPRPRITDVQRAVSPSHNTEI